MRGHAAPLVGCLLEQEGVERGEGERGHSEEEEEDDDDDDEAAGALSQQAKAPGGVRSPQQQGAQGPRRVSVADSR